MQVDKISCINLRSDFVNSSLALRAHSSELDRYVNTNFAHDLAIHGGLVDNPTMVQSVGRRETITPRGKWNSAVLLQLQQLQLQLTPVKLFFKGKLPICLTCFCSTHQLFPLAEALQKL
jgi:hypothetical protein